MIQFNGADFVKTLDKAVADANNSTEGRKHLGASVIGRRCPRQIWYAFRWTHITQHTGRLHRLFKRGHEEEFRFVEYLRGMGCEVRDYRKRLIEYDGVEGHQYDVIDWEDKVPHYWHDVSSSAHHINLAINEHEVPLKQYGFCDFGGHFGGSSDGKVRGPGLPDGWGLAEFKTHNDKSFKLLVAKGVLSSKPVHYIQMQIYMRYMGLQWALYLAVNKNDDTIHAEVVYYRPEVAEPYIDRAGKLVGAQCAPDRITEDSSWFECKFCDDRETCFYGREPAKSCRSCIYSRPDTEGTDGDWYCAKFHATLPKDFIPKGCDDWEPVE